MTQETKLVYAAISNTDRTEGTGELVYLFGETKATAKRIGKGQDVQGCDCDTTHITLTKVDNVWMIPFKYVRVHRATKEDLAEEAEEQRKAKEEEVRKNLVIKLQDLDLTMEEIGLLVTHKIFNRLEV